MATNDLEPHHANAAGGFAPRRALWGLPLLCASAPADPKARHLYRPMVDPVPQEFLDGVRFLHVQGAVFLWHDGGWVALGRESVEGWTGLLRHEAGRAAWVRADEAAARSLRGARPRAGRPVEPPVTYRQARASGAQPADDPKSVLGLRAYLRVRDATETLPAAERDADARLFAAMDSVEFRRASLASTPYRGEWPLAPGLVVEAAPAAEVEERVLARLEAVVGGAIASVRDSFR